MSKEFEELQERYLSLKKEYENYAYIVSHDLNAPLRHIKEFTRLLTELLDPYMNKDAKEFRQYINSSVATVESKLGALLKLSRINTSEWHYITIDTKEIILNAIRQVLQKRTFEFALNGDFPKLSVDPDSFQTAFFHVIDNAAKFQDSSTPLVEVNASVTDDNRYMFTVKDKGVGIPANRVDDVFEIFKRLSHKYEGEGVGLALAQKIIARYKGETRLHSILGSGTEVAFILPGELAEK